MWETLIGGGGLLAVITLVFGLQSKRIDKKMSKDVCDQRREGTDNNFRVIENQQKECSKIFRDMNEKLANQQATLIEVKTILDVAAKKNGWHR